MKIVQLNSIHTSEEIPANATDVHIGIEHLNTHPLNDNMVRNEGTEFYNMYSIMINNYQYYINECDILEFDELEGSITVSPSDLDNNTLVTIGYNITSSG